MKRRIMSILVVLSMVFAITPSFTLTARAAGSGTADDPFLIYNYNDLAAFRDTVNAGNYGYCGKLMADITMPTTSWAPIAPTTGYTGTFDGNGHTISGLKIAVTSTANIGLFGVLNGGTITNVALANASIVNSYAINELVSSSITIPYGYIVGNRGTGSKYDSSTTITNYAMNNRNYSYGRITTYKNSNQTRWCGVSQDGYGMPNYWKLLNEKSTKKYVTGFTDKGALSNSGGLVAVMNYGTVMLSSFSGTVNSNYARAGGLIGWQKGGTLDRCYSNGSVNGTNAGGAVGVLDGGTVTDCYSTSAVSQYSKTATIYNGTGTLTKKVVFSTAAGYQFTPNGNTPDSDKRYYEGALTGYNYVHTAPTSSVKTIHTGYSNGFACNVSNTATITNAYYYNTSAVGKTFSNNLTRGTRTYSLGTETTEDENNAFLDADSFAAPDVGFEDWDFRDTWTYMANLGRPTLYNIAGSESVEKPYAIVPEGDDALLIVTADDPDTSVFTLSNYIKISNGTSSTGKFIYRVTEGDEYATVSGNYLTVAAGLPMNDYTVTLHAYDPDMLMNDFDVTFTIRAVTRVPIPQVLTTGLKYSRALILEMIPITLGWNWVDSSICPREFNSGYPVFYQYEDDKAKFYDTSSVTAAGFEIVYDEDKNGITVILPLDVADSDESPVSFYITVTNADTDELIGGAELSCEYDDQFPNGNKTATEGDNKGKVYAAIPKGEHEVTVKADGFTTKTEKIDVLKPGTNTPTISLVPVRTPYTAAIVKDKDKDTVVEDGLVTITRLGDGDTKAWNDGNKSIVTEAGKNVDGGLPDGRYEIKNATEGYSHEDVTYILVKDGKIEYYTDDRCSAVAPNQEQAAILYAVHLSEPMYELVINKDASNLLHYTATLTLKNVDATYGTFGLQWDTELFRFDPSTGVHIGSDIKGGIRLPEQIYNSSWDEKNGYYDFMWSANNGNKDSLNTEIEGKTIATFDFMLRDISLADMITVDTFTISPWTDNKAAKAWAAEKKEADPDFDPMFWEYWRECDTDNLRNNLKTGRIDAANSVVNSVETNGFFQVAVSGEIGSTNPGDFYDAMTTIKYGFTIKNSVIRFHVLDKNNGDEIEGAKVSLFNQSAEKLLQSKNTNYVGRANFTVNTAYNPNPEFAYAVQMNGYWPLPQSGLSKDRPHITTETGKATEVEVELEKKIYHLPVVAPDFSQVDIIGAADLGGEKYAYNNRDYHFRIKGAKGYRITRYPDYAYVAIGDENAGSKRVERVEIEPDENGIFTLDAKYLMQDELTKEYMDQLAAGDPENNIAPDPTYADVQPQPDSEGYRSYNVVVTFSEFEFIELEYLVEGMTNANGTVTYDTTKPTYADGGEIRPAFFPDPYNGEKVNDIKVKTKKSVRDDLDPNTIITPANHRTGTFTFEANPGYMVEKVFINGLQIHTYDDMTKFSYTFGDVDMDCSIIVLFWDGEHPSTDSVLTLVVGDYGFADVTSPVEETGENALMCTRRTYLNPDKNLEFTTRAYSNSHELYLVEREIEGEDRVDITGRNTDGKYTIAPVEGKNVITYVTFKNKKAEITPTVLVKSYIYFGQGVANPVGILIYNIYDSVEIEMTADSANSWLVRGVMLSPYDDLDDVSQFEFDEKLPKNTYRYDSLTESIGIGSVFMEKAYPITGIVDLSQRSSVTEGAPIKGATIKFVRLEQDEDTGEWVEKARQVPFMTDSTNVRKNSVFSTELPEGKWNVYVMKQGYVTYKITNFDMPRITGENPVAYKFGTANGSTGTQQIVVPLIGSTETGNSISLTDAKNVKSGMRGGVTKTVFEMADVDNNNDANYVDLAYVWKNYNQRMFTQEYSDFCSVGSASVPSITLP